MAERFHRIPAYLGYGFWTDIRRSYAGADPGELLTDIGQMVIDTLRDHPGAFSPEFLFSQEGPPQTLFVLPHRRLVAPFVQMSYIPSTTKYPERLHVRIQPFNDAGEAYQTRLIAYLIPLGDFDFNKLAQEIVVRRTPRDISASSGYPTGIGIETDDDETPGWTPDEEGDDLGDHLGCD